MVNVGSTFASRCHRRSKWNGRAVTPVRIDQGDARFSELSVVHFTNKDVVRAIERVALELTVIRHQCAFEHGKSSRRGSPIAMGKLVVRSHATGKNIAEFRLHIGEHIDAEATILSNGRGTR